MIVQCKGLQSFHDGDIFSQLNMNRSPGIFSSQRLETHSTQGKTIASDWIPELRPFLAPYRLELTRCAASEPQTIAFCH
jgi:hypothetical protein